MQKHVLMDSDLGAELRETFGETVWLKISQAFLLTLKTLDSDLTQHHRNGALLELRSLGHRFKGPAALIGDHKLSELFGLLESTTDLLEAEGIIRDIIDHYSSTKSTLENLKAS